jgi:D-alanyl-D-alanine carboxypeptidase/D-alanyl-D-alanine-endopeptidase (penicillin-binding protein 4)
MSVDYRVRFFTYDNNMSIKCKIQICSVFVVLICQSAFSASAEETLKNQLQGVLKASGLGAQISASVIQGDDIIWEHQAGKKTIPASLTKIVTAAAALKKFPLQHKFKTQLFAKGKQMGSRLKGDIYIKGGGDPAFVSESMWVLVNHLSRSDIQLIEGGVVVDDSFFDDVRYDESRDPSRVDRAYDAPVGAMSFNWNSVNVYVRPGKSTGAPAIVTADPESGYIRVVNQVKTVQGNRARIQVSRDESGKGANIVTVTGTIGVSSAEVVKYKSITDPVRWSAFQLMNFLGQRGIVVSGGVKAGTVPAGSRLLAEVESRPVAELVKDMMKFSNNYVAEMLTKNLGAQKSSPGTMKTGVSEINEFLKNQGLAGEIYIENPSGLSRKNRVTARGLGRLLSNLQRDFLVAPEFLYSLPIAGVDGTLKSRMNNTKAAGKIRAKTGLLNGVAGLAGYASRGRGEPITFVFLFNGRQGQLSKGRQLLDDLAVVLAP